jgi:lipopolysaccharide transport system permease protein
MLKALWEYRNFVISSIRNEFISRFARSRLGGLWMLINPLAQVAIFALILSNVLAAKLPGIDNKNAYALYLMAGTLAWSLFSEIVSRCLTLFIDQGNLIKKMRFPRMALPAIVVGSSLLNNVLLSFSVIMIFSLMGHPPTLLLLWVPCLVMLIVALGLGAGLILGVLNVFIRDVGQVVPVVLQILYWFTPVVYPINTLSAEYRDLLKFNPMYPIVSAYHDLWVYDTAPAWEGLIGVLGLDVLLMIMALLLFRRASPEMVDAL